MRKRFSELRSPKAPGKFRDRAGQSFVFSQEVLDEVLKLGGDPYITFRQAGDYDDASPWEWTAVTASER